MKFTKLAIICLIFFSTQASANNSVFMSLNTYQQLNETEPDKTNTYLSGLIAGYNLANAMLEKKGKVKLYCLPKGVTIKIAGIKSILNQVVNLFNETKKHELLNSDIGGFTLSTLTETYPCKK